MPQQPSLSDYYEQEISPLLPDKILDFHAHTWLADNWKFKPWDENKDGGKYMVTDTHYPPEQLLADGKKCFPDKKYLSVIFGYPTPAVNWQQDTEFVAEAARHHPELFPLILAGKNLQIPREKLAEEIRKHNFYGYKVFLDWLGNDYGDVRIEDMLSDNEMSLANELKLVVLLHVPRSERLADPEIQQGVTKLAKTYPDAQIVLAHCGRCYLPAEMKKAIKSIKDLPNVSMDASMVMDTTTIQIAMNTIGPERLLFATDFPVAAMKGRRVRVMDHWVDVVLDEYPDSAFRVKSNGIRATFMAVEIAAAILEAAELTGISATERRAIFYDNGMKLLKKVNILNTKS